MTPLPTSPFDFALIGAGRVGTAVALLLQEAGHRVAGVSSRTTTSAERAAALLSAPVAEPSDLPSVDVVLIGVPDHALSGVAPLIGATGARVAIHFAGSVGPGPLASSGAAALALHPVQACPDVAAAVRRLPGSAWGVTCDVDSRAWAHRLIEDDLHGMPVDVEDADRARWHAAAVTTSNGIAALMAIGESLLSSMGIDRPEKVLGPIAQGTVANAIEVGGGATALTGPVVRKEADVIRRHVEAVSAQAPDLLVAYKSALRMIVQAALTTGRIGPDDASELNALLENS